MADDFTAIIDLTYEILEKIGHKDKKPSEKVILVDKLLMNNKYEKALISKLIDDIRTLELYEEYNISLDEFNKIMDEKHVYENLSVLLQENLDKFKNALLKLKEIYSSGTQASTPDFNEDSMINSLSEILKRTSSEQQIIKQYFTDMKNLPYDKRYIYGARVIDKIIKKMLYRIHVFGLENVPKSGPVIIAPHHIYPASDPVIFFTAIPRKLFFLACIEPFHFSIAAKYYPKLGVHPGKRVDKDFGEPKPKTHSQEELDNHPASNRETALNLAKLLKYGEAVCIFPEGDTRFGGRYIRPDNEEFLKLQPGTVQIAMIAAEKSSRKIPIIPVGLKYEGITEKFGVFKKVTIKFGQPINIIPDNKSYSSEDKNRMIEVYNQHILEQIKELSK